MDEVRGLWPTPWTAEILPIVWQQVFINWLQAEVPQEMHMPILTEIYGWRNREVYDWLQATKEHRDMMAAAIYG